MATYGELTQAEQAWLGAHLAGCARCSAYKAECEAFLRSLPGSPMAGPADEPSSGFLLRLTRALTQASDIRAHGAFRTADTFPRPRRLGFAAAAGAALLLAGVLIGRYFIPGPQRETPRVSQEGAADRELLDQIGRTREYLDRTRTLLLGIVNARQVPPGEGTLDLRREQEESRALTSEGRALRAALRSDDENLQRLLIDEIDVLLVQLATLEEHHAQPGIDIVRREVEQRGILLKINMAELKMAGQVRRLSARTVD